jgi:hypothetical protein
MRGQGVIEQSRFRVTLELTQAVLHYFDEKQEPKGQDHEVLPDPPGPVRPPQQH